MFSFTIARSTRNDEYAPLMRLQSLGRLQAAGVALLCSFTESNNNDLTGVSPSDGCMSLALPASRCKVLRVMYFVVVRCPALLARIDRHPPPGQPIASNRLRQQLSERDEHIEKPTEIRCSSLSSIRHVPYVEVSSFALPIALHINSFIRDQRQCFATRCTDSYVVTRLVPPDWSCPTLHLRRHRSPETVAGGG